MKERLLDPATKSDPKVRAALKKMIRDVIAESNTAPQDCISDTYKS